MNFKYQNKTYKATKKNGIYTFEYLGRKITVENGKFYAHIRTSFANKAMKCATLEKAFEAIKDRNYSAYLAQLSR